MTENPISADRKSRLLALGFACCAFVVPWWAITWSGAQQFQDWPAAAVPFGLNRILVVHLLAAMPFCFWVGWRIPIAAAHRMAVLVCIATGALLALVSFQAANQISEQAVASGANFIWRTVWVTLLALPWCLAAVIVLRKMTGIDKPFWSDGVTAWLLLIVPLVYTGYVVERQSLLLRNDLEMEQYRSALQLTQKLAVIGDEQILGESPGELLQKLQQTVSQLQQATAQPLPSNPTRQQRLQRAYELFCLGEFEQMKQLIAEQASVDPMASFRLAMSFEAQGQSTAAVRQFRTTIRLIEATSDPSLEPFLRSSVEHLANNLRRAGDYAVAEEVLLAGLNESPELRDTFLLQLGYHYSMAGRTSDAVDYFEQAAQQNPKMRERADAEIAKMSRQAEGCLLRAIPGATR